jgi:hypothetical protein
MNPVQSELLMRGAGPIRWVPLTVIVQSDPVIKERREPECAVLISSRMGTALCFFPEGLDNVLGKTFNDFGGYFFRFMQDDI